jgi:hypothetical protein
MRSARNPRVRPGPARDHIIAFRRSTALRPASARTIVFTLLITAVAGCAGSSQSPGSTTTEVSPSVTPAESRASSGVPTGYLALEGARRENAQLLITTPAGRHVYIDYFDTTYGPDPGPDDILLTTYDDLHWPIGPGDLHANQDFVRHFPGTRIMFEPGRIDRPDVTVVSIPANHLDGAPDGTDYIMVVDVEGFRIVAFGDCGQSRFTQDQLAAIGRPDIAMSQLWNPRSLMSETNSLGLAQMKQIGPLIFIPSHRSFETLQQAVATWPSFYHKGRLLISRAMLPASTTMVLLSPDADVDGTGLGLGPIYQSTPEPSARS